MKSSNPVDRSIINGLASEVDALTKTIATYQVALIAQAKTNDKRGIKGNTGNMQVQLEHIKEARQKISELEADLEKKKKRLDREYEEMEKIIAEKEKGVWQSPIGGLEV